MGLAACHSACGSALRVCVGACVRTRAAWVRACPLTRREEHGTANGGTDRITNRRRTGRGSGRRAMGSCRTTHNAQRAMQHASTHPRIHARARKHARDTCTHTHATSRVHLTSKRAAAAAVLIKPIWKTSRVVLVTMLGWSQRRLHANLRLGCGQRRPRLYRAQGERHVVNGSLARAHDNRDDPRPVLRVRRALHRPGSARRTRQRAARRRTLGAICATPSRRRKMMGPATSIR